jgi:acetate kinase
MKILIINSGSSSIKCQLFDVKKYIFIFKALIEKIGYKDSIISCYNFVKNISDKKNVFIKNHEEGIQTIIKYVIYSEYAVINNIKEIHIIGHRVVHGGGFFKHPVVINNEVKLKIKSFFSLAPLHNHANYKGIIISEKLFPQAKQIAVFDTSFHCTLSEHVYKYAIPSSMSLKHKIRKYGFHGISHKYVSSVVMNFLKTCNIRIISIHLGNGASVNAIKNGLSYDISMGFSPNSGLIMGTRSGDIDSSIVFYAMKELNYSYQEVYDIINKHSGILGLFELSSDMRDLSKAYHARDDHAKLIYEIYTYRIKHYIGGYIAAMNGVDCIIFTGGIGENDYLTRLLTCTNMEYLGISIDKKKNNQAICSKIYEIHNPTSKVKIFVVPTNEEYQMIQDIITILK